MMTLTHRPPIMPCLKTSKKGTARGLVDTHGGVNFGGKVAVECKERRDALRYQITVINVTLSCRVNNATGTPRDARVKQKVCVWVIQVVLFRRGGRPTQVRLDATWYGGKTKSHTHVS